MRAQVRLDGCEDVAFLIVRVNSHQEADARGSTDPDASPSPVDRLTACGLVKVSEYQYRDPKPLSHLGQWSQGAPHVLIAMRVHVGSEEGHEWVNDDEQRSHAPNAELDSGNIHWQCDGVTVLAYNV